MRRLLLFSLPLFFLACQQIIDAPVPDTRWAAFEAPGLQPLTAAERQSLEGIYATVEAADDFGNEAALKWSYVAQGADTTHILSFFCSEDVRYFLLQAKKKGDTILLNGYWRNVENTKTGKARLTLIEGDSLRIRGLYGMFNDEPEKPVGFQYQRPLNRQPLLLIAHRGGGRNNDLLPASENSLEMLPLAAQLGANGVEIDVQLTKDSMPILYHDARINDRLTTKTGIQGPLEEYTLAELNKEVTLKRGGKIPTLQQALDTILLCTPLEFVWLDCKYNHGLPTVVKLQEQYRQKAAAMGRKLEIVIGIPDEDVLGRFLSLPDYRGIPSLCELDTAKAAQVGALYWAPSWTKGHQDEDVKAQHAAGRKALVWTVDVPDKIKEFLYEAHFDGMVTNRPTMAAYYQLARK